MADKEVHVVREVHDRDEPSSGVGSLLAVILVIAVVLILGFFLARGHWWGGNRDLNADINVNVPESVIPDGNGGGSPAPGQ